MKKISILLFVTLIVFNCQKEKKESFYNIEGNWSLVNADSIYYEVKFETKYIEVFNIDYSFLPLRPYKIEGDSLHMRFSENDKKTYSYFIDKISNNEINLSNTVLTNSIKLHRIDSLDFTFDKIVNIDNEDEKTKFELSYLNRKNKLFGTSIHYNIDSILEVLKEVKIPELEKINTIEKPSP